MEGEPASFSIGRLANYTGIAVDTLRKWEQRYGYPQAERLPSGHRRYGHEEVRRLRRIAEAIQRGVPVRTAVSAREAELEQLLSERTGSPALAEQTSSWLKHVQNYSKFEFGQALEQTVEQLGVERFLEEALAPWLTELGALWAQGELDVRHEHFATEVIVDLLRSLLARHGSRSSGPRVVFATLPGEHHVLGLWMGALSAAHAGADARLLGANLPLDEIAHAAIENGARGVAISISLASGGVAADRMLAELRDKLGPGVNLMVGGDGARGARRGPRGVSYFESFGRLTAWVNELARRNDA